MSTNNKPGILSAERLAEIRATYAQGSAPQYGRAVVCELLAHIDAIAPSPGEVDAEALGREAFRSYPSTCGRLEWESLTPTERTWCERIGVTIHAIGYAAGLLAPRPPGATCEGCATLRERLATAESERDEARAEAGALVEQRELIRSELRAHGSETTQRAAARLTAELAAEREELASAREGCRGYAVRIKRETEQARDEGAREERGAIAAYLREEGQDSTAMRVLRARGAR